MDEKLDSRVREVEVESTELYVAKDASCNDLKYFYFQILVVNKSDAD